MDTGYGISIGSLVLGWTLNFVFVVAIVAFWHDMYEGAPMPWWARLILLILLLIPWAFSVVLSGTMTLGAIGLLFYLGYKFFRYGNL